MAEKSKGARQACKFPFFKLYIMNQRKQRIKYISLTTFLFAHFLSQKHPLPLNIRLIFAQPTALFIPTAEQLAPNIKKKQRTAHRNLLHPRSHSPRALASNKKWDLGQANTYDLSSIPALFQDW